MPDIKKVIAWHNEPPEGVNSGSFVNYYKRYVTEARHIYMASAGITSDEAAIPTSPHIIRESVDELIQENIKLKARLAEETRNSARATRQFDQVLCRLDKAQATNDEMIARLNERAKASDALQAILIAQNGGRIRMFEAYEGTVKHVNDDSVVLLFQVNSEFVEQTYSKTQFIDERMPLKGDRMAVYVHVALLPPTTAATTNFSETSNDKRPIQRQFSTGPLEL